MTFMEWWHYDLTPFEDVVIVLLTVIVGCQAIQLWRGGK